MSKGCPDDPTRWPEGSSTLLRSSADPWRPISMQSGAYRPVLEVRAGDEKKKWAGLPRRAPPCARTSGDMNQHAPRLRPRRLRLPPRVDGGPAGRSWRSNSVTRSPHLHRKGGVSSACAVATAPSSAASTLARGALVIALGEGTCLLRPGIRRERCERSAGSRRWRGPDTGSPRSTGSPQRRSRSFTRSLCVLGSPPVGV
jgi:hypothetical protein